MDQNDRNEFPREDPEERQLPVFSERSEARRVAPPEAALRERQRQDLLVDQDDRLLRAEEDQVLVYSDDQEQWEPYRRVEMEEVYRPPALVTLVFVLTMLAIYFMGRTVEGVYPSLGA